MSPNKVREHLAEFYVELRALWQEIDYYDHFQTDNCPDA